jgi:enoyl-CoA hydratase
MPSVTFHTDERVGVITLNKPEARNAQDPELLQELDDAWRAAASDREVRVIVLQAKGKHFSAGHDLKAYDGLTLKDAYPGEDIDFGGEGQGIDAAYKWEAENFFGRSRRWRDVPKPSIAAVQGACIAAGLSLCWPCDLIVASDDAFFSDPVALMGVAGVEYQAHTWELGPRKAKEMLFTAGRITAEEAWRVGMVNRLVPREELESATMELAREIARVDPFALAQIKRVVNLTTDIQGQSAALDASYDNHWLGHANALSYSGNKLATLANLDEMKKDQTARPVDSQANGR